MCIIYFHDCGSVHFILWKETVVRRDEIVSDYCHIIHASIVKQDANHSLDFLSVEFLTLAEVMYVI